MIFRIYRTNWQEIPREKPCEKAYFKELGNGDFEWNIEINTLEDLKELNKEVEEPLILFNMRNEYSIQPSIEIYDTNRE